MLMDVMFAHNCLQLFIFDKKTTGVSLCSLHPKWQQVAAVCPLARGVDSDHLMEEGSLRLLHLQLPLSHFAIHKHFVGVLFKYSSLNESVSSSFICISRFLGYNPLASGFISKPTVPDSPGEGISTLATKRAPGSLASFWSRRESLSLVVLQFQR